MRKYLFKVKCLYMGSSHKCYYVVFIVNFEQVFANWDAIRETCYFHVPFVPTETFFRQISLEESSTVVFLIYILLRFVAK